MPKWIHERARHIQAKNPGMSEQVAFAVATQQAHKLKKTPKGYGTSEGKKKALSKFDKPRKQYVKGADPKGIGKKLDATLKKQAELLIDDNNPLVAPRKERRAWPWLVAGAIAGSAAAAQRTVDPRKIAQGGILGAGSMYVGSRMLSKPIDREKTAEERSNMSDLYEIAKLEGFSDELLKIAETKKERAHKWGVRGALGYGGLNTAALLSQVSSGARPSSHILPGVLGGAALGYGGGRLVHRLAKGPATDEKVKEAASIPGLARRASAAAKSGGKRYKDLLAGGAKKKPGLLGRVIGRESERPVKSITGIAEARAAKASGDMKKLKEIRKVQGARAGTAAAAGYVGTKGVKKHRKTERQQLGRAYVTGARDMYGQLLRAQYGR